MLDQTILFVTTETALAHDTHDNTKIVLSGSASNILNLNLYLVCNVLAADLASVSAVVSLRG